MVVVLVSVAATRPSRTTHSDRYSRADKIFVRPEVSSWFQVYPTNTTQTCGLASGRIFMIVDQFS